MKYESWQRPSEALESRLRFYSRYFDACFSRGSGPWLYDTSGREYLDFFCGAGALNYGHNHPVLKEALLKYVGQDGITHTLDMWCDAKDRLLTLFRDHILAPRALQYRMAFSAPTGTDAIELALKLVRAATGRRTVVGFTGGYHGVTAGSLAVSSSNYHRSAAGIPLENALILPFDGFLGEATDSLVVIRSILERLVGSPDAPAAFVVETVQGEGGLNVASECWLNGLQQLAGELGMLLIIDEVQTGCGRVGPFFSFEQAGLKPDVVCLSKSLSGYGLPLSMVLIRDEIDVLPPGAHTGTFRGLAPAFVTAACAIETFWSTDSLHREVDRKGNLMEQHLRRIAEACECSVKGSGMIRGIEFADGKQAADIVRRCFARSLVLETSGPSSSVVKLLPPLNIDEDLLMKGLRILEECAFESKSAGVLGM